MYRPYLVQWVRLARQGRITSSSSSSFLCHFYSSFSCVSLGVRRTGGRLLLPTTSLPCRSAPTSPLRCSAVYIASSSLSCQQQQYQDGGFEDGGTRKNDQQDDTIATTAQFNGPRGCSTVSGTSFSSTSSSSDRNQQGQPQEEEGRSSNGSNRAGERRNSLSSFPSSSSSAPTASSRTRSSETTTIVNNSSSMRNTTSTSSSRDGIGGYSPLLTLPCVMDASSFTRLLHGTAGLLQERLLQHPFFLFQEAATSTEEEELEMVGTNSKNNNNNNIKISPETMAKLRQHPLFSHSFVSRAVQRARKLTQPLASIKELDVERIIFDTYKLKDDMSINNTGNNEEGQGTSVHNNNNSNHTNDGKGVVQQHSQGQRLMTCLVPYQYGVNIFLSRLPLLVRRECVKALQAAEKAYQKEAAKSQTTQMTGETARGGSLNEQNKIKEEDEDDNWKRSPWRIEWEEKDVYVSTGRKYMQRTRGTLHPTTPRIPVVTLLGHSQHGKTTLLDRLLAYSREEEEEVILRMRRDTGSPPKEDEDEDVEVVLPRFSSSLSSGEKEEIREEDGAITVTTAEKESLRTPESSTSAVSTTGSSSTCLPNTNCSNTSRSRVVRGGMRALENHGQTQTIRSFTIPDPHYYPVEHSSSSKETSTPTPTAFHSSIASHFTFVDTPGIPLCVESRFNALVLSDYALLVVSLVDGVRSQTCEAIKTALNLDIPLLVVLTHGDVSYSKFSTAGEWRRRVEAVLKELFVEGLEVTLVTQRAVEKEGKDDGANTVRDAASSSSYSCSGAAPTTSTCAGDAAAREGDCIHEEEISHAVEEEKETEAKDLDAVPLEGQHHGAIGTTVSAEGAMPVVKKKKKKKGKKKKHPFRGLLTPSSSINPMDKQGGDMHNVNNNNNNNRPFVPQPHDFLSFKHIKMDAHVHIPYAVSSIHTPAVNTHFEEYFLPMNNTSQNPPFAFRKRGALKPRLDLRRKCLGICLSSPPTSPPHRSPMMGTSTSANSFTGPSDSLQLLWQLLRLWRQTYPVRCYHVSIPHTAHNAVVQAAVLDASKHLFNEEGFRFGAETNTATTTNNWSWTRTSIHDYPVPPSTLLGEGDGTGISNAITTTTTNKSMVTTGNHHQPHHACTNQRRELQARIDARAQWRADRAAAGSRGKRGFGGTFRQQMNALVHSAIRQATRSGNRSSTSCLVLQVLVKEGTLVPGMPFVADQSEGTITHLVDCFGQRVASATPGMAVTIIDVHSVCGCPVPGVHVLSTRSAAERLPLQRYRQQLQWFVEAFPRRVHLLRPKSIPSTFAHLGNYGQKGLSRDGLEPQLVYGIISKSLDDEDNCGRLPLESGDEKNEKHDGASEVTTVGEYLMRKNQQEAERIEQERILALANRVAASSSSLDATHTHGLVGTSGGTSTNREGRLLVEGGPGGAGSPVTTLPRGAISSSCGSLDSTITPTHSPSTTPVGIMGEALTPPPVATLTHRQTPSPAASSRTPSLVWVSGTAPTSSTFGSSGVREEDDQKETDGNPRRLPCLLSDPATIVAIDRTWKSLQPSPEETASWMQDPALYRAHVESSSCLHVGVLLKVDSWHSARLLLLELRRLGTRRVFLDTVGVRFGALNVPDLIFFGQAAKLVVCYRTPYSHSVDVDRYVEMFDSWVIESDQLDEVCRFVRWCSLTLHKEMEAREGKKTEEDQDASRGGGKRRGGTGRKLLITNHNH